MGVQKRLLIMVFAATVVGVMIQVFAPGKPYPDCDNGTATAALAKLYDNRHLLHAAHVSDFRHIRDGLSRRYCSATVKWDNGLESEVPYEFYRSGRQNRSLSMWIEYNGGMHGPSY